MTFRSKMAELQALPEELNPYSILSDEELEQMLTALLSEYILREDDPIQHVGRVLVTIQQTFIDPHSLREFQESNGFVQPKLSEAARKHEPEIKRQRAMYLQWKAFRDLPTYESENVNE